MKPDGGTVGHDSTENGVFYSNAQKRSVSIIIIIITPFARKWNGARGLTPP